MVRGQRFAGRLPRSRAAWLELGLRIAAVALLVEQLAAQVLIQHPGLLHPATIGSDPANYYAAAQRLNLGHALYGPLQAGDIPVPLYPGFYPAPLLSPPLIAVAWRPLALLPFEVATTAWWAAGILLTVAIVLWCAARGRRTELIILIAVLLAGLPIAYLRKAPDPYLGFDSPVAIGALSGNINVLITALLVLGWWAVTRAPRRPDGGTVSGTAFAIAAALKLTPLSGFVWLAARRAWPALVKGAIAFVVLGLVGLIGAGVGANLDYVRVALEGHVTPTTLSLPGIANLWFHARLTGSARYLPVVAIAVGLAATWLLRHHPRASFAAAILTSIWGSPVVLPGNFMLLLALAAPSHHRSGIGPAEEKPAPGTEMVPPTA